MVKNETDVKERWVHMSLAIESATKMNVQMQVCYLKGNEVNVLKQILQL